MALEELPFYFVCIIAEIEILRGITSLAVSCESNYDLRVFDDVLIDNAARK